MQYDVYNVDTNVNFTRNENPLLIHCIKSGFLKQYLSTVLAYPTENCLMVEFLFRLFVEHSDIFTGRRNYKNRN